MKAYAAVMGKLGKLSVSHIFLHSMSFVLLNIDAVCGNCWLNRYNIVLKAFQRCGLSAGEFHENVQRHIADVPQAIVNMRVLVPPKDLLTPW